MGEVGRAGGQGARPQALAADSFGEETEGLLSRHLRPENDASTPGWRRMTRVHELMAYLCKNEATPMMHRAESCWARAGALPVGRNR